MGHGKEVFLRLLDGAEPGVGTRSGKPFALRRESRR
jgi:hypothetical protein